MKYIYIFIFVGPGGPSIIIVDPSCISALLSPISIYMSKIQSIIFVHVWEVLGDHLLNPRFQSVSELRPHHHGDICTTRKITSSSYMGHDVKKNEKKKIGGALARPGEDFNNRIGPISGPISVRIYNRIYVNVHVKYGRNLIITL